MGADKTKSIMTLSSGVSQPLLADVQYFELYSSLALNRKLKNIVMPGFYCGFEPVPGTGLSVRITSENSEGKGAASVDVNNVQISVQQIEDVTVSVKAGATNIIVLEANFEHGVKTTQVDSASSVSAARIYARTDNTIGQNQIELCRVIVPSGATAVTKEMIVLKYRVNRAVGVEFSNEISSTEERKAATPLAVKTLHDLVDTKAPLDSPHLSGTPTSPTPEPGTNNTQIANAAFVYAAINALINGAPGTMDTLKEIAAAINNDPKFSETINKALALKAPLASPAFTGTPTVPTASQGTNSTQIANTAFVKAAITALINGAPGTLDTLKEIAAAINNDPNFSTTINNALALKAPLASPALTGIPTAPTAAQGTNNTQIATTAYVRAAISALVGSSPEALDTLNELAAALGNDPNFATTMTNALAGKQPLDATLTALAGLTTGANKLPYFTGTDTVSQTDLTSVGRDILAKTSTLAVIQYLGLREIGTSGEKIPLLSTANTWSSQQTFKGKTAFSAAATFSAGIAGAIDPEDIGGQTVDLNNLTIRSDVGAIKYYYCPTSGGGANITNKPDGVTGNFLLRVESTRKVSASDYANMQTLISNDTKRIYVRFVVNGSWAAWSQVVVSGWGQDVSVKSLSAVALSGSLTGNASTATKLQTVRTIGGVSFDGSANIDLPGVNKTGNQSTTGNAATATKLQTARTIGGVSFDGSANIDLPGVNKAGNQSTTGNAATATKLQTARTIGGVSFDGSANIDLPGVNKAGNQSTTGNAATATKLQTARTIGGVSFDGTANINLPGVNVAGNQNTSGNAATATKLQTARTINGVLFDGSKNIELTPRSIGTINSTTMSFSGGTGWFKLATVTMPQASSVVYISLIGGAGYNVNSPMQAGISELVLRAGSGNPKGLTGALWRRTSVGFTNFAWVNTSGDTYDVYVEIGNYATGVNIQWDYTSNASVTIHTSPTYTANKPKGLTDGTVYVIYSSHIKPTATDVGALPITGGNLNGGLTATGEIISKSANGLRIAYGNYGFFIRNDGSNTYFMLTNSGNSLGTYNNLRPLIINNANGTVTIGNGLNVTGGINGSLNGNAATATKLQTVRTIGGVSFDGSANIDLPGVNKTGNQSTTGNAATATKLQTARTIGGVSFDGSANIDLPGVNKAGNQSTTGNAATATKLQTARTINGVKFDGSANITLTAANLGLSDSSGYVGRLVNTRVFTSSGTYTPTPGTKRIRVTITGGGGGGGGCQATSNNETFFGAGGGAGGTIISIMTPTQNSYPVTIGAGGGGGVGATNGLKGGDSSFGTVIAPGGEGGGKVGVTNTNGGNGGAPNTGDVRIIGGHGGDGQSGNISVSGEGGSSFWGGGGRAGAGGGVIGRAYGSGGGGAYDAGYSGTSMTGGKGAAGICIIEEFA
ncbi:TPA: phage tail protein [Escherichia coli]|uniref:Phage tail protein n=1 Tax=Escherichia coli TaxID=562 RepID=A0A8H9T661_ECOLX|nr:phage tail protein [Escherichia coli]HBB1575179.1 phage tail protein [Escherichia coli]